MKKTSKLRKAVHKWAQDIGEREAVGRLVIAGVSSRAAEGLCSGTYESEPKATRDKILEVLAKDNISVDSDKAC